MSHTPGPWKHEKHDTDYRGTGLIWSQNPDWEPGMYTSPNRQVIAEVIYSDGSWRGTRGEEFESNAALIAAAPEMLVHLKGIRACLTQNLITPADTILALRMAEEAIAKAEGKV